MAKELPNEKPDQLYGPLRYIMELGGKRIRPLLALWACEASGQATEKALPVALAVEAFHNFSLIHDDIMDDAPLRQGLLPSTKNGIRTLEYSREMFFWYAHISFWKNTKVMYSNN